MFGTSALCPCRRRRGGDVFRTSARCPSVGFVSRFCAAWWRGRTRDVGPLPAGGGAAGTYSVRWPVARQGRIQSVGSAGVLSVFLRFLPASSCINLEIKDEESKRKIEASAEIMATERR